MSLSLLTKNEPEFKDGDSGEGGGGYSCEECGGTHFALKFFMGVECVICIDCCEPQQGVAWVVYETE